MRRLITWLGAGSALALLILGGVAPAEGDNIPLHKVPKPVLDAVRDRFKGARLLGGPRVGSAPEDPRPGRTPDLAHPAGIRVFR
jgi:hypothetical protein